MNGNAKGCRSDGIDKVRSSPHLPPWIDAMTGFAALAWSLLFFVCAAVCWFKGDAAWREYFAMWVACSIFARLITITAIVEGQTR